MTVTLSVGFVPLVDAAPLFVAQAMGFAEQEGLSLVLHPATSWAALRDMLAQGQVSAAQMLSPVPVAQAVGLAGPARFEALAVLNLNGDTLGVSRQMESRMRAAGFSFDFKDAVAARAAVLQAAPQRLRIGVPFPFSLHAILVDYWLGAMAPPGLEIITVPPALMAQALVAGQIDAFCVGEPWGSVAVDRGAGALILPGSAIWAAGPEKVLAARKGWADATPDLAGRLIRAVWAAGRWLDQPANRTMTCDLLAAPTRLDASAELIERALTGRFILSATTAERWTDRFISFHDGAAGFPWRSQAEFIGARLALRFGLNQTTARQAAKTVFRSDLYRLHLAQTGADLPGASERVEGALHHPTPVASARGRLILGADRFFDARIFDPAHPDC